MKKLCIAVFFFCISTVSFQTFAACPSNHRELLFRHNVASSDLFTDDAEALSVNTGSNPFSVNKYSRLSDIEDYRQADSTFVFKLSYPNESLVNERSQTSNPTTEAIAGYTPINIANTSQHWGGLEVSSSSNTYIDGSVSHPNRYFAIGAQQVRGGVATIPGPGIAINLVIRFTS